MNRRKFLIGAGAAGGTVLFGGLMWGRAVLARQQLAQRLVADALPELTAKAHAELHKLPVKARDEIRTWFHGPCLNSAEFVYEICSRAFAEKLSACASDDLKELCFLNAFVSKVVSETEILNRVTLIAEEIGSQLDGNWATCCSAISSKWDVHIRAYGSTMPQDFVGRIEPLVRKSLDEIIAQAKVAGQRPAIGETASKIGKAALLVLPMKAFPKIAIPLFAFLAMQHLFDYIMGQLNNRAGNYQRNISERLALLGHRIGSEFEREIRTRLAGLHTWQEQALKLTAENRAKEIIRVI